MVKPKRKASRFRKLACENGKLLHWTDCNGMAWHGMGRGRIKRETPKTQQRPEVLIALGSRVPAYVDRVIHSADTDPLPALLPKPEGSSMQRGALLGAAQTFFSANRRKRSIRQTFALPSRIPPHGI